MNKFLSLIFLLLWSARSEILPQPEDENSRKLFFTTTRSADTSRFEQMEELKAITRKQYLDWMHGFQLTNEVEEANFTSLQNIHQVYDRTLSNILRSN